MRQKYLLVACLLCSLSAKAQGVSYIHDAAKANQISVMESGTGDLNPSIFYNVLHNNYTSSAASTNKTLLRNAAVLNLQPQKKVAEDIDSALVNRALVESLNMADRTGGGLDMAWKAEGGRITAKLEEFQRNINKLSALGITTDEREHWTTYYKMFEFTIWTIREAYLPNAKRKQQYLNIYQQLCERNKELIQYTAQVLLHRQVAEQLNQPVNKLPDNRGNVSQTALQRWKQNGKNNQISLKEN